MSCGENLLNEDGVVPYSIKPEKQEIIPLQPSNINLPLK